jgi:hypothetical protein
MKTYGGSRDIAQEFLTMEASGQLLTPTASPSRERERAHFTHCVIGWVGPRAGPETQEIRNIFLPLPGIEHLP